MNINKLISKDLQHVWHPCSIMKNFSQHPPLVVTAAQGSYIQTDQGRLIDGISSWWCKSLGHGHPKIVEAIKTQLSQFEHVMPANTTHPKLVALAETFFALSNKQHIYFASDGASAVEIALKLAIQATMLQGEPQRNQILALRHAYHGETLGALSVSDLGLYKYAWNGMGMECHFLDDIPYVADSNAPLWSDAQTSWNRSLPMLENLKSRVCAIIVEPLIQGANGLRPYSADYLKKLAHFARQNNIYLIADEIMTGLGRTGTWFACEQAGVEPDMICLSKGLTSGSIPMSCVLIDHKIYDLFYAENDPKHCFLHSHTFGGNALAIAAALATVETIREENILQQAQDLGAYMFHNFQAALQPFKVFSNFRTLGAVVAADYQGDNPGQFSRAFAQAAQQEGALLRPIGATLYWLPPLNTPLKTIDELSDITVKAVKKTLQVLMDPAQITVDSPCIA